MIQIEETGFLPVVIGGVELPLDLYLVHNRLSELRTESEGKSAGDFYESVKAYMAELGYPEVSHQTADKFAIAIWTHVGELQKKAQSAESPSPTPN